MGSAAVTAAAAAAAAAAAVVVVAAMAVAAAAAAAVEQDTKSAEFRSGNGPGGVPEQARGIHPHPNPQPRQTNLLHSAEEKQLHTPQSRAVRLFPASEGPDAFKVDDATTISPTPHRPAAERSPWTHLSLGFPFHRQAGPAAGFAPWRRN